MVLGGSRPGMGPRSRRGRRLSSVVRMAHAAESQSQRRNNRILRGDGTGRSRHPPRRPRANARVPASRHAGSWILRRGTHQGRTGRCIARVRGVYTWTDDNVHETAMEATKNFVSRLEHPNETNRVLATILFTDIVGSTELISRLGDSKWRDLLQRHHATVRRELSRFRGRELDTAGDGFFAAFDGPARAVHAATAIRDSLRPLGIRIRAGIHVGECELNDDKIVGVAVSVGARIAAVAGPGEVLVSRTVKDLVAGSDLEFEDRGEHDLKGLPERWQIFSAS